MALKETQEALDGMLAIITFVGTALEDGKIDIRDAIKIVPILGKVRDALVGGQLIPAEVSHATVEDWQALATKAIAVIQAALGVFQKLPA